MQLIKLSLPLIIHKLIKIKVIQLPSKLLLENFQDYIDNFSINNVNYSIGIDEFQYD